MTIAGLVAKELGIFPYRSRNVESRDGEHTGQTIPANPRQRHGDGLPVALAAVMTVSRPCDVVATAAAAAVRLTDILPLRYGSRVEVGKCRSTPTERCWNVCRKVTSDSRPIDFEEQSVSC